MHLLLWHLSDRWGRIGPAGVILPLPLSRALLAELVCSTRESVSRALTRLALEQRVVPFRGGFLLLGPAPAERDRDHASGPRRDRGHDLDRARLLEPSRRV